MHIYTPPAPSDDLIVHKDPAFLIVNKPSGLLSVPGRADTHKDCLESRVQAQCPQARIVHRLDMDTSGLVIFALDAETQKYLGQQFEARRVGKTYIARVWGAVEGENGEVDLPLRCDWPNRPRQMVCHEHGKPSQTQWRVIAREDASAVTRVELTPITGRSHQLRVHMLSIGHPILGDDLYADSAAFEAADRLQLHAQHISFQHPVTAETVSFSVPCPF